MKKTGPLGRFFFGLASPALVVMPGLVPGIHVFLLGGKRT
jgi:hypothetical protein